jgi:lysyl-tRNA synthetase class 2
MAFAFESLVEEKLMQPTIVYDYPVEVSPLAKKVPSDPRFVERFEAFALGSEIGNNYSELNDPVDLEKRFLEEKNREAAGFDEAHQTDMDYLEAIKHGMPPACGLGIGIDRMVMLLTGAKNIKEVILFPTLRPERSSAVGE